MSLYEKLKDDDNVGIMPCDIKFDLVTTEYQWFLKEDGNYPFVTSHNTKNMSMNAY